MPGRGAGVADRDKATDGGLEKKRGEAAGRGGGGGRDHNMTNGRRNYVQESRYGGEGRVGTWQQQMAASEMLFCFLFIFNGLQKH